MHVCGSCGCYRALLEDKCVCLDIVPDTNYLWAPGTRDLGAEREAQEVDRAWRGDVEKYVLKDISKGNNVMLEPLGRCRFQEHVKEGNVRVGGSLGRPYYVVSYSWWSAWKEYALWDKDGIREDRQQRGPRPPPIDNSDLLPEDGSQEAATPNSSMVHLRPGLKEDSDYVVVPPLVWRRLWAWYGGGPAIRRPVLRGSVTALVIDLYPVQVHVVYESGGGGGGGNGESNAPRDDLLSSTIPIKTARILLTTHANRAPHKTNMFLQKLNPETKKEESVPLTSNAQDLAKTLEDYGVFAASRCHIVVRFIEDDASYASTGGYGGGVGGYWSGSYGSWTPPKPPTNEIGECLARGVCGLYNLGNTCFMNSSLFCLSAIPPLATLMLHPDWVIDQVNKKNLLGSKGELAMALSGLFEEIWSGHYKVVVPDAFRKRLQTVAPQFRGYQQHDAQEMLLMTLSTLHEDLLSPAAPNGQRVEKSSIQDMFGGMFQSTIVCDTCKVQSSRKETFLNLAVPVPEKEERKLKVTFFPARSGEPPIHLGVRVNKSGNVQHLYQRLSEMHNNVAPDRLAALQVSGQNSCYQVSPAKSIAAFREKDRLLVFELPHAQGELSTVFVFSFERGNFGHLVAMGSPILVWFPKGASGEVVARAISERFHALANVRLPDHERVLRLVKFGGKEMEKDLASSPFPYQAAEFHPAADLAVGVEWDARQAEQLKMAYQAVQEDRSCGTDARDAEMTVSLTECLNLLNVPDTLTAGDQYRCETCKGMREAVKTMSIWQLPPVLCIHLKRFKIDFVAKEKLHTLIRFTEFIDMAPFVVADNPGALPAASNGGRYRLVAVSNHVGGLSGGHYTADAWNAGTGKWYHFDDRNASETKGWEASVTPSAYVLYYVAEGLTGLDLPEPIPIVKPAEDEAAAVAPAESKENDRKTSTGGTSATGGGGDNVIEDQTTEGSESSAAKKLKGADSISNHGAGVASSPGRGGGGGGGGGGGSHTESRAPIRDDHFRHHDSQDAPRRGGDHSHHHPHHFGGGRSGIEDPPQNLAGSAYICDICQTPIAGGFDGLLQHCAQVHDTKM